MTDQLLTIPGDLVFDWNNQLNVRDQAKLLSDKFLEAVPDLNFVNRQPYREKISKSVFYVPLFVNWRKYIDAPSLLESSSISDKRKKIVRQALAQSDKHNISYQVVNPLNQDDFQQFLEFYRKFNEEQHYDVYLDEGYFQKYDPKSLFLIKIVGADGHYYGGRMVKLGQRKISTDYRAIERTKLIKEGFDTVCEKIFYDLGVNHGAAFMSRGQELNLKGIGNRSLGLLWNKLKWGYKPFIFSFYPRVYQDYAFLKTTDFDLAFFVSIENNPNLLQRKQESLILNFVCGQNPDWNEIKSVKEKSMYQVRVWDMDFNQINEPTGLI